MSRLCIATRGIGDWKLRLASSERQWKPEFSAFEMAVSWEIAANKRSGFHTVSGLPGPIEKIFRGCNYDEPVLMSAVAEHKVELPGGVAASQCDVWAVVKTVSGLVSLTVEAKVRETFGRDHLEAWLNAGETEKSKQNRKIRWNHVHKYLPQTASYLQIRYQILHRCAAAVIEAERFGFTHAAFIVQSFNSPDKSFQDYAAFCQTLNIPYSRGSMATTLVNGIFLSVGWADCSLATDEEVAAARHNRVSRTATRTV